jgi:hypothetical protein
LKAENRKLKLLLATATTLLAKARELLAKPPRRPVNPKKTRAPKKRP